VRLPGRWGRLCAYCHLLQGPLVQPPSPGFRNASGASRLIRTLGRRLSCPFSTLPFRLDLGTVYVEIGGHDRWKRRTEAKASEAFISGLT
jgi:hypothetical protein